MVANLSSLFGVCVHVFANIVAKCDFLLIVIDIGKCLMGLNLVFWKRDQYLVPVSCMLLP